MMQRQVLGRRIALAIVSIIAVVSGLQSNAASQLDFGPSPSVAMAQGTTTPGTLTPTATLTPQEACTVAVNKTERYDFTTQQWVAYNGEALTVMPFETVKLRYDLNVNIPDKHQAIFSALPAPWSRLVGFNPRVLTGSLVLASASLFVTLVVPEVEPGSQPPKSIVGNQFTIQPQWRCEDKKGEVVNSGPLGQLVFQGIAGPAPGSIEGRVSVARDHPCPHPATCPVQPADDCIVQLFQAGGLIRTMTSSRDGGYLFETLLPGTYSVVATGLCGKQQRQAFVRQEKPTTVQAQQRTTVDFQVQRAR
jgi:hypothetical protein